MPFGGSRRSCSITPSLSTTPSPDCTLQRWKVTPGMVTDSDTATARNTLKTSALALRYHCTRPRPSASCRETPHGEDEKSMRCIKVYVHNRRVRRATFPIYVIDCTRLSASLTLTVLRVRSRPPTALASTLCARFHPQRSLPLSQSRAGRWCAVRTRSP